MPDFPSLVPMIRGAVRISIAAAPFDYHRVI
jgi:hypothetical protein